jgi:dCTP deaminase
MILPAQTLRIMRPVSPWQERTKQNGMTYGCGPAGYDVRIAESLHLVPGEFCLASTMECFSMPDDVLGVVHDKSTWARRGLFVQNTVIEPGWTGYLTLELTVSRRISVSSGDPIAQIIFHRLEAPTDSPYRGKYQNQAAGPQIARVET